MKRKIAYINRLRDSKGRFTSFKNKINKKSVVHNKTTKRPAIKPPELDWEGTADMYINECDRLKNKMNWIALIAFLGSLATFCSLLIFLRVTGAI